MRELIAVLILGCLGAGFLVPGVSGQEAVPAGKVRVVTRDLEPFSFVKEGRRVGYAAELWDQLARETGLEYEVSVVGTAQEIIDALKEKRADVGVGALSVTAQREGVIDFSQPFYKSGLQVLVAGGGGSFADNVLPMLMNLFNLELIGMFLLLLGTMVLISYLVWLYEHKVNEDQWPADKRKGLWESFWWTVSTLLVGGADNKGPVGVGGRSDCGDCVDAFEHRVGVAFDGVFHDDIDDQHAEGGHQWAGRSAGAEGQYGEGEHGGGVAECEGGEGDGGDDSGGGDRGAAEGGCAGGGV
jgi:hypothetical protein